MRLSGSGRGRRIESPALAGEVLADEELDRIIGGEKSSGREGSSRGGKRKRKKKGKWLERVD